MDDLDRSIITQLSQDARVSVAVRWHGPNPAVLWDVTGDPVALSSGVGAEPWVTTAPSGEALWLLPA